MMDQSGASTSFGFGFVPTSFGDSTSSSTSPFSAPGSTAFGPVGASGTPEDDYENEPPLLEELGINFSHIKQKTVAVLNPFKREIEKEAAEDADLAGPFVFALLLGATLLLRGKWTFDYIYGFGAVGTLSMYFLINVMGHDDTAEVSMYTTLSVLGYCLLPMVLPAALSLVLPLTGIVGASFAGISVLWCTASSAFLFTSQHMPAQRLLVAYPLFLFYACFALLTVF